jgi:hypothetical protein
MNMEMEKDRQDQTAQGENPLQQLIMEASGESLSKSLLEPLRLSPVDLRDILSRNVMILSAMAAELGIILRIRMSKGEYCIVADPDKVKRLIVALIVHVLAISKTDSRTFISLNDVSRNGDPGVSLELSSTDVILPETADPDTRDALNSGEEMAACVQIVESHRGSFYVLSPEEGKIMYSVWFPSKGKTIAQTDRRPQD